MISITSIEKSHGQRVRSANTGSERSGAFGYHFYLSSVDRLYIGKRNTLEFFIIDEAVSWLYRKRVDSMLMFILGAIFGGIVAFFAYTVININKPDD